jgi:essential nuclear protein 1
VCFEHFFAMPVKHLSLEARKRKSEKRSALWHQKSLPQQLAGEVQPVCARPRRKSLDGAQREARSPGHWSSDSDELRDVEQLKGSLAFDLFQGDSSHNRETRALQLATEQLLETDYDLDEAALVWGATEPGRPKRRRASSNLGEIEFESDFSKSEESSLSGSSDTFSDFAVEDNIVHSEDSTALLQMTEEERDALRSFELSRADPSATINLADLVAAKLREGAAASPGGLSGAGSATGAPESQSREARFRQLYESVGEVMHRYKSGKVPKAFKLMPALRDWYDAMWLTRPEQWSPQALFVATKAFASNLDQAAAQKFYTSVLLPRCREDISARGKLNVHLFQALRKATYKPQAFYKGLIFPLIDNECSLREAAVFGAVLNRCHIPALHSAAALLYLSQKPYSGPVALFIRVLLDKNYALPRRVIEALLKHFLRTRGDCRDYPVLWHQSLLAFVQYFKSDLSAAQVESLRSLLREKRHHSITPAIHHEIQSIVQQRDGEI